MTGKCARLAGLFIVLVAPAPVWGYDESVHFALIQALALERGFSKQEAALIANASQSIDDQTSTTAYDRGLITQEGKDWKAGTYALEDLPHMRSGQLFHALTATENRPVIEQMHIDRLRQVRESPEYKNGTEERRQQLRRLELVYVGQYLHFVADSVVHPHNPLIGHLLEGDWPDRAQNAPDKLLCTIRIVSEKLGQYKAADGPGTLKPTPVNDLTAPAPELTKMQQELADALKNAWLPTKAESQEKAKREGTKDVYHVYDKEIAAKGSSAVDQVLAKHGHKLEKHEVIRFDSSGDPTDIPESRKQFGHVRSIERLPLESAAALVPALKQERKNASADAALLAFSPAAQAASQAVERQVGWKLPTTPGGIALNPGLELPGGLGDVERITLDEQGIVLVTARGTFAVEGLDPQTFATILKTVASGQVPFITIGTEPSDRTNYARVTVTPALHGTREAEILYRADVQFKAIFGQYLLGHENLLNRPDDSLVAGYPGLGGESGRFWITSSGIRLKEEGGGVRVEKHGMRILGETRLLGQVVPDPELDAYAAKLTANWDAIADQVWEFRAVQDLALGTELAFWARQHRIPVDELIWNIPPRFRPAVDYAPLVAVVGRGQTGITGGVCLTPEDKSKAAGRKLLFMMESVLNQYENRSKRGLFRIVLAVVLLLFFVLSICLPSLVLWLIARWSLRGTERHARFGRCVRTMLLACLSQGLLAALIAPLVFGDALGWFDRLFLAFMATFVAAPPLLYLCIRRAGAALGDLHAQWTRAPVARFAVTILGMSVPLWTAGLGESLAGLTVTAVGPTPDPMMERALSVMLAPENVLGETQPLDMKNPNNPKQVRFVPVPGTVLPAWGPMFKHTANPLKGDEDPDLVQPTGARDPNLPVGALHRVNWPTEVPVDKNVKHFTPDGHPPY